MKIKILIDLRRFFSNAQHRSLTSELSEDQNHINFPDVTFITFIPQSFAPYDSYAHSAYPFTSIHPSPSNYEYLSNIPVTSYSLPVNLHFHENRIY